MPAILRAPALASESEYDAIIVGGGIYGSMLALESVQKGLKVLLLEKDDFGGATSFNSLRIIHGGLRYLQTLDLPRFFESVRERRWFLRTFPELIKPLPCLMPLYGKGIKRNSIFRFALLLNDILSIHRNKSVEKNSYLNNGTVLSSSSALRQFPWLYPNGLTGAAVWYDACVPDSQRLIMDVLKNACSVGACALNYVEAIKILKQGNRITGLIGKDHLNGKSFKFNSEVVINATGPWAREFSRCHDIEFPNLLNPSIAWNILFDRKAMSDYAVAISPNKPSAQTYFLHPWKGMMLVGTGHKSWLGDINNPVPNDKMIDEFIADLNSALPDVNLQRKDILYIYAGILPAKKEEADQLAVRPEIVNHGKEGGVDGLYSISGVKFTTSRAVAEKALKEIFPNNIKTRRLRGKSNDARIRDRAYEYDFSWNPSASDTDWLDDLKAKISEESVCHIDDLLFRRTSLGDNSKRTIELAPLVAELFSWDSDKISRELQRLEEIVKVHNGK